MLSCRSATASLGNVELRVVALLKGFPQGGVLSALVWILIADSLLTQLNGCRYDSQGYADDFSILAAGFDLGTVCSVMQTILFKVQRRCERHDLSVNPTKTEMVLFTHKRKLKKTSELLVSSARSCL